MVVVFAAIVSVGAAVFGVIVLGMSLVVTAGDSASAGRAAIIGAAGLVGVSFVAFQAVMFVWQSSGWTLVWRDRTGRDAGAAESSEPMASHGVAVPTIEGGL